MTRSKLVVLYLLVLTVAFPAAVASEEIKVTYDPREGLLAWYPFDEDIAEKTGNIEPIDVTSTPPIINGKFGGAVKLDGDTFVALPVDLGPDLHPSITISLWVKTDPRPTDPELEKNLPNTVYVVSESIAVHNLKSDNPYFYGRSLKSNVTGPKHTTRRGRWQHVALVRTIEDRPDADGNVVPHVVSQFHSGGRMSEYVTTFTTQSMATDLYVGTEAPSYKQRRFRGAIDELRIYNRALSQDEVKSLANAKAGSNQSSFGVEREMNTGVGSGQSSFGVEREMNPGAEAAPSGAAASPLGATTGINPAVLPDSVEDVDLPIYTDNRDAATSAATVSAVGGSPSVGPQNESFDDFQDRVDDPEFQDSLKAVDWNLKGMIPLTQEQKANIYPGSIVNIKIRVDKDDPANHIPDVQLILNGDQNRASVPFRVMTSDQVPTASREIPMTITVPADFEFEREGEIGAYRADIWLLAADGRPLRDTVTSNNNRTLTIQVKQPPTVADCGETKVNADGTRSTVQCLIEEAPSNALNDWDSIGLLGCDSVASFVADLWSRMNPVVLASCAAQTVTNESNQNTAERFSECTTQKGVLTSGTNAIYAEVGTRAVNAFNKLVGDSWATLGPRSLLFNKVKNGTIIFPGDRTFVTTVPSRSDAVSLNVNELDGKARVKVVVCRKAESGQVWRLKKDIVFNYNKRSSSNENQNETFLIGGVKDSIISVIMKSQYNEDIAVTNVVPKFEYAITVNEELR